MDHIVFAIPWLLAAGLFYPKIATLLGLGIFIGREGYINGYISEGPNSQIRYAGGITLLTSEILIFIMLASIAVWRGFLRKPLIGMKWKRKP